MNQNGCLQDLHHQRAKPAQTKITTVTQGVAQS